MSRNRILPYLDQRQTQKRPEPGEARETLERARYFCVLGEVRREEARRLYKAALRHERIAQFLAGATACVLAARILLDRW